MFHSQHQHCRVLHPVLCDPTSYQLRKHLPRLLHGKQFRAGDMLRCTRVCTALLLQVWRTEVEHRFPKSVTISRTPKSPSKGMSATKSARHSVLRQIYGKYSGYSATSGSLVSHQSAVRLNWTTLHPDLKKKKKPYFQSPGEFSLVSLMPYFLPEPLLLVPRLKASPLRPQLSAWALPSHQPTWPSDPVSLWPF